MPKITQTRALRLLQISNVELYSLIESGELKFQVSGRRKMFEQSEVYRVAKKLALEAKQKVL